jgi:iron complex transport system substrate-binding protein
MYASVHGEVVARPLHRTLCAALGLATLFFSGCMGGRSSDHDSRSYIDGLGRTVEVPNNPTRVVSLAPSLTEIVFLAGAGDRLVAVTTADDYPPAVSRITQIGAFPLNHEAVVAQSPDLVLATDQVNNPHDLESISELGIPVVFLKFESIGNILTAVSEVGSLLNTTTAARSAAASLTSRWTRVLRTSSTTNKPKLLVLIGHDILYAFGGDSYVNEMIAAAGAISVTAGLPGQSAVLSDEFVLGSEPDIIIVAGKSDFTPDELLANHPSWDVIPAVRNNRVFSINPDLISRPGPRVIEGTERIAELVSSTNEAPPG